ncbi:MAG: hypothetical protein GVY08_00480 [Bacteroidetes bacterium]|jgi:hypothetical protein|nr:hypothetical protein [Bacteroidota bacterium]
MSHLKISCTILILGITLFLQGCAEEAVQDDQFSGLPVYQLKEAEVLSDQGDLILGRPVHTEIDSEGNRLVMDLSSFEIHVYDSDGIYQNSFGREGSGPGEFKQPQRPVVGENDTLYINDGARRSLLVFYKSGEYEWSPAYDVAFPQTDDGFPSRALTPSPSGYPIVYGINEETEEFPDGYDEVHLVSREGNILKNTNVAFQNGSTIQLETDNMQIRFGLAEMPGNRITPKYDGTYYQAWTGEPVINHYTNEGERIGEIPLEGYPVQEVTADAIASLNDRMFSGGQFGDMSGQLRENIGETFPLFSIIKVMKDESIWLSRITPETSDESWYHLSPEGDPLGQLSLAEGERLRNAVGDEIYVSGVNADGTPAIIKYRLITE